MPRFALLTLLLFATSCLTADYLFGDPTAVSIGSGGNGGEGGGQLGPRSTDRVDLLLTIDNSRSMADKQVILQLAVEELMTSLVNPRCVDADGSPTAAQPETGEDPCPPGATRPFSPVTDINVGVITTSLGGHGSDACRGTTEPMENDRGWLIARDVDGDALDTYDDLGFLNWDPAEHQSPPGETDVDDLIADLSNMVLGAGQLGCGYEAQLESWYRFLIDPAPYKSIEIGDDFEAELLGLEQTILDQRADFLRHDSLVVILVLSDENDCSIRDGSQYYFAAQLQAPGGTEPYRLPKPRYICGADPNDTCCRSCGQVAGNGCDDSFDDCDGPLEEIDDHVNLRCHDQKRRFGVDFLYPIERYSGGLSSMQVADRYGNVVDNPLYAGGKRDPRLVFFGLIGGVPWQDIARKGTGNDPDLVSGLDANDRQVGAFQSAAELVTNATWEVILGYPEIYHTNSGALPDDPLMHESVEPRSGSNPVTGEPIAPPGSMVGANSINGHEYTIAARDDLQYACIFDLVEPRNCASATSSCDCQVGNDNPLCQNSAGDFGTTQYRAKAYPSLRELQVARELGDQAVVGSICPAQLDDSDRLDFGYIPSMRTLVEAMAPVLE